MKQLYSFILSFCLLTSIASAESRNFITGFEDIPLIKGFQQIENDNFSFGNEETRYIEAQLKATSKKNFTDVKKFYLATLKQLGWIELKNSNSELHFYRENDILEINKISNSPLRIRIILKNRL